MKLGLQGHSIFNASGDSGVAGPPGENSNNCCLGPKAKIISPAWPNLWVPCQRSKPQLTHMLSAVHIWQLSELQKFTGIRRYLNRRVLLSIYLAIRVSIYFHSMEGSATSIPSLVTKRKQLTTSLPNTTLHTLTMRAVQALARMEAFFISLAGGWETLPRA